MKKILLILITFFAVFSLSACGGKVENAKTHKVKSEIYSEEEINSAIDVIKSEFKTGWKGCTLTEIYYAGDEISKDHQDWADRNEKDDVIVLLSTFDVAESGAEESLNPGDTYSDWMWILVRDKGGKWKHVDHGY